MSGNVQNFVQATSDNLPSVDSNMISDFFLENIDYIGAEIRGNKASRAAKQHYGDSAIGFVQLYRERNLCTVKGQITPEHRVRNKDYNVTVIIDEEKEQINAASCSDCAASAGGCKHAIAFIFWLHRKTEEPAPTSVACYWKKSVLSKVGKTGTFMRASDIAEKPIPVLRPTLPNFKDQVLTVGLQKGATGMFFDSPPEYLLDTSLYYLGRRFKLENSDDINFANFESFCSSKMTDEVCSKIEFLTKDQRKSSLWEKERYGRITASRIYEASRCKTYDGCLTEIVMGATDPLKLDAVIRGQILEEEVLAVVGARMDVIYEKSGIFISKKHPFFGASPDAINDEYIFEVKCPSKESTIKNYVKDEKVTPKPFSQMQLQMHLTGRQKGLFCIASPSFETNSEVQIVEIKYDKEYCSKIMEESLEFWQNAIFKYLIN